MGGVKRGVDGRIVADPLEVRFARYVDENGPVPVDKPELGPCHVWTGSKNELGYGQLGLSANETENGKRRPVLAHRVSFFLMHGRWPQPHALQTCRNHSCVRLEHLIEGTHGDTMIPARELPCRTCGGTDWTPTGYCRHCRSARDRERGKTAHRKLQQAVNGRARRYHFSVEQQNALFAEQGGLCRNARCRAPITMTSAHLDHDHACCNQPARSCGHCIRGFLCKGCSVALGEVNDSVERLRGLIDYLESSYRTAQSPSM